MSNDNFEGTRMGTLHPNAQEAAHSGGIQPAKAERPQLLRAATEELECAVDTLEGFLARVQGGGAPAEQPGTMGTEDWSLEQALQASTDRMHAQANRIRSLVSALHETLYY